MTVGSGNYLIGKYNNSSAVPLLQLFQRSKRAKRVAAQMVRQGTVGMPRFFEQFKQDFVLQPLV